MRGLERQPRASLGHGPVAGSMVAKGQQPQEGVDDGSCVCAGRQRVEVEELRRQLEASSSALTRALKEEFAKEKEEQQRRHQVGFAPCLQALDGRPWVQVVRSLVWLHRALRGCGGGGAAVPELSSRCLASPQAEVKVLKEQLEVEKQAWEASYVKKEVTARAAPLQRCLPLALRGMEGMIAVSVPRKPGCSPGNGSCGRR